jgi:hypothetical protein
MAYPLTAVVEDPAAAAAHLLGSDQVYGVAAASGHTGCIGAAILELTLAPLPALAVDGYPIEQIRVVVLPDGHSVHAYPRSNLERAFLHRNVSGDLCLQYREDDSALRWLPSDGLEPLVTLIRRHLLFEERWRRTGTWPCEDTPHGNPGFGTYSIRTAQMKQELRRWQRP